MEIRYRIYPVNIHDFCEKCAVFLDPGPNFPKEEGIKYMPKEQFDEVEGSIEDDEQYPTFSVKQIMGTLNSLKSFADAKEFYKKEDEKSHATVKFFGEMTWQGHSMVSMNRDTGQNENEFSYKCNNKGCNHEKIAKKQYPVTENVEGRVVKHPMQLGQEDDVIKRKIREHVGSAVLPNAKTAKLPNTVYGVPDECLEDNTPPLREE